MSEDPEFVAGQRLVECIRRAFPGDAESVDARLRRGGFAVDESPYLWIEHFSHRTTDVLEARDIATFKAHVELLSSLLRGADQARVRCIDVAYVESLMWGIEDDGLLREGWSLVPENLQALYVALWGKRPFMGRTS